MNKICVTGASGFIGRSLCEALVSSNKSITGFIRNSESIFTNSRFEQIQVGNINSETNWKNYCISTYTPIIGYIYQRANIILLRC